MPSTTHTSWIERAGLSSAKLPTRWGTEGSSILTMSKRRPPDSAYTCPAWMKVLWTPPVSWSSYSASFRTPVPGSDTSRMTSPFRRLEAPSREITAVAPSSEIFTSLTVRASTCTTSTISRFSGSVTSQM